MNTIFLVIILTVISGIFGTGLGGVLGLLLGKESSKANHLLLALAGGVMTSVVCFDLVPEAIEYMESVSNRPVIPVILLIAVGYMLIYLIHSVLEKKESAQDGDNLYMAGIIMSLAICLHNFPVGTVIGASFANTNTTLFQNGGFLVAFIIGIHNIPEGMSVALPILSGGGKKKMAVIIPALSGVPTVIGAILGYSLGVIDDTILSIALSVASGAMIFVIFEELLPQGFSQGESKNSGIMALLGLLLGLLIIFL